MLKLSKSSCGQYLRSLLFLLVLTGLVSACQNPLSLLTGGGPNVAANTQIAKTATQTLGSSTVTGDQNVSGSTGKINQTQNQTNRILADNVDKITVNETPVWVILLLILGWLLPTPNQIARTIIEWLKKIPVWKR